MPRQDSWGFSRKPTPAEGCALAGPAPRAALLWYSGLRQAADVCQATAVTWLLAAATGSAPVLGVAAALGVLPWLAAPLTGMLGDRAPRRQVIRAADGAVAVLAVGMAVAASGRRLPVWLGYAWVLAYASVYAVGRPATKGLAREVAAVPDGAAGLSGALTSLEYAVIGCGQLAAAVLLISGRAPAAFAATAVLCAAALILLGRPRAGAAVPARRAASLTGTVRRLWRPPFRAPLALTVLCGACTCAVQALAPLLVLRHLHAGVFGYALCGTAGALGSAAGAASVRKRGWRGGAAAAALVWTVAAPGAAAAGLAHGLALALPGFALLGAAAGFQDAGNAARVAALVPADEQSGAMALGSLVWRLPRLLGGGLAALGALAPTGVLCAGLGGLQAAVGVAALVAARRRCR